MLRKPDERALKPVRGRPRDPERSRRILEAARAHFYAHGLERASVHAIAAEAGVSKMTIYSNFGSKEGLFEAVVRERTDRMMGGLAAVETLDPQQLEKSLTMIGEQFLMLTRDDDAIGKLRTVYGAAGSQPEACRAFYRHGPERLTNELAVHLRPTHAAGTLKMRNLENAEPASGSGPVPVDVLGLRSHPRTAEARDAGSPGKQGSSARGRTGVPRCLCGDPLIHCARGYAESA
jgi:TetR/AcrR family transcriptional repressor of mexJK operon